MNGFSVLRELTVGLIHFKAKAGTRFLQTAETKRPAYSRKQKSQLQQSQARYKGQNILPYFCGCISWCLCKLLRAVR